MGKQRVRILTSIVSADWSYAPRQEAELDADLAAKWIGSGIAEPVEPQPQPETPQPEKPKRGKK